MPFFAGATGVMSCRFINWFKTLHYSVHENEKKLHSDEEKAIRMPKKKENLEMLELQTHATLKRLQTHRCEWEESGSENLSTVSFPANRILLEYRCIE